MDNPSKLHCTVLIVLERGLYKREAVDVAHISFPATSQHVKTTNILFEFAADAPCHFLFFRVKINRVANFLSSRLVSLHLTINRRASASFGMCIVFTDCINLDVEAISWQELLI